MKFIILLILNIFCLFSMDLLKNINTLKMNFNQSITYDSGKIVRYSGIIHIKKPYYIKWEYQHPIERNIYIMKNNIVLDEPELEQVSYIKINKNLELFKIFRQTKKVSKNTYIASLQGKKYKIIYENKLINKIIFKDELENNVNIIFSKHRKNISYKNSFFIFSPPSHYDVLR